MSIGCLWLWYLETSNSVPGDVISLHGYKSYSDVSKTVLERVFLTRVSAQQAVTLVSEVSVVTKAPF